MPDPAQPNAAPVVLGIAGGIGSGKSKVAGVFDDLGWLCAVVAGCHHEEFRRYIPTAILADGYHE
ncbi:MAG: hypothetical protein ACF8MJ_07255 [Phycisphaerales bacterium JB050]